MNGQRHSHQLTISLPPSLSLWLCFPGALVRTLLRSTVLHSCRQESTCSFLQPGCSISAHLSSFIGDWPRGLVTLCLLTLKTTSNQNFKRHFIAVLRNVSKNITAGGKIILYVQCHFHVDLKGVNSMWFQTLSAENLKQWKKNSWCSLCRKIQIVLFWKARIEKYITAFTLQEDNCAFTPLVEIFVASKILKKC